MYVIITVFQHINNVFTDITSPQKFFKTKRIHVKIQLFANKTITYLQLFANKRKVLV